MFVPIKHVIILPPTGGGGKTEGETVDPEFPATSRLEHMSPHARAARAAAEMRCPLQAASRENCPVPGPSCASCVCVCGGGVAPPLDTGTVRVPTTFRCRGSLSGPPKSLLSLVRGCGGHHEGPHRPELAHLRQDGEVLILVLLQLEGRGGKAVAQGPEGTRPPAPPP